MKNKKQGEDVMKQRIIENNKVTLSGEIVSDFTFSHKVCGEGFYITYLSTERISGAIDVIPIIVSERLVDVKADWKGIQVKIGGQFRSHNKYVGDRSRLSLSVFVMEFEEIEVLPFTNGLNRIFLDGHICKHTDYRITPFKREICDVFIAVNRQYGKSDYIPCIVWGRNARFASGLNIGTHIQIEGRIQSRKYLKRINETDFEERTIYEVSANTINVIEESEGKECEKED